MSLAPIHCRPLMIVGRPVHGQLRAGKTRRSTVSDRQQFRFDRSSCGHTAFIGLEIKSQTVRATGSTSDLPL